jgi:hypothetical protein
VIRRSRPGWLPQSHLIQIDLKHKGSWSSIQDRVLAPGARFPFLGQQGLELPFCLLLLTGSAPYVSVPRKSRRPSGGLPRLPCVGRGGRWLDVLQT